MPTRREREGLGARSALPLSRILAARTWSFTVTVVGSWLGGPYFKTIQHVQLSGAEPVLEQFRAFISTFSTARTPRAKMLAIDGLIHGFHWYYRKTHRPTRPVAINLIEGRLREVIDFLDRLTYGDKSTPGTRENYAEWMRTLK